MAMCTLLLSLLFVNAIPDIERTLDAISVVESSDGKDTRDGDRGRAIGRFQIHRGYWADGTRFLGVNWPYEDARDPAKARQVVRAYLLRYQRAGEYPATLESWAAIHNGGPTGPEKEATKPYVAKVSAALRFAR